MQNVNDVQASVVALHNELAALRAMLAGLVRTCDELVAKQSALGEILSEYRELAASNLVLWADVNAAASNAGMGVVLAEMQATFGAILPS